MTFNNLFNNKQLAGNKIFGGNSQAPAVNNAVRLVNMKAFKLQSVSDEKMKNPTSLFNNNKADLDKELEEKKKKEKEDAERKQREEEIKKKMEEEEEKKKK